MIILFKMAIDKKYVTWFADKNIVIWLLFLHTSNNKWNHEQLKFIFAKVGVAQIFSKKKKLKSELQNFLHAYT